MSAHPRCSPPAVPGYCYNHHEDSDEAMGAPQTASLLSDLRRDFMHAKDIVSALEVLARRLDEEGVPFGVVERSRLERRIE